MLAQLALDAVELVAMVHRGAGKRPARVLLGLIGHHDDSLDAFGSDLARDHRRRERSVVALPAGHRNRVVEQDLVGDRRLGRDRGADREDAGMEVRITSYNVCYTKLLRQLRVGLQAELV